MKKTYRNEQTDMYWENRWGKSGIDERSFQNLDIYPVKYADKIGLDADKILEAGCGTGRLYFHYKNKKKNIVGLDFSKNAIDNILSVYPDADVMQGSILDLPYENNYFDALMAFGLYHGLENYDELMQAFKESNRVLKENGKIVFSVRLNGLENDIIEYKTKQNFTKENGPAPFNHFHKWQFDLDDIYDICKESNFKIESYEFVRNVSFLFKWNKFRSKDMKEKIFNESQARSQGFKLNRLGRTIDNYLHNKYPSMFSNLIVVIASK